MQFTPSLCSTTPQLDGFRPLYVALSGTQQHQPIAGGRSGSEKILARPRYEQVGSSITTVPIEESGFHSDTYV